MDAAPQHSTEGVQHPPFGFYDHSGNVRSYLSRAELTKLPVEQLHRYEPAQTPLFKAVLAIPGVVTIIGKPYEILVQKADLYAWEELHPAIMDLIMAANLGPLQPASSLKQ